MPDAPTTAPRATGFPDGWQPPALDWERCDLPRGGRCATLVVPLDWDDPGGPTIDLRIGRIPAGGDAIGPLLMNPGGPGGSGLEYLSHDPVSSDLAERFDLVGWDPRGVGASTAVRCDGSVGDLLAADPDPDTAAEQAALDAAGRAVSSDCGATQGDLLPHVGSRDVARDMEAIRRALAAEQISYLGFSYGTLLGQLYADMFPDRVRAMALDGVVDPTQGYDAFLLGQLEAFEARFRRDTEACAEAGARRCGVGDLGAAYDEVKRRVEVEPLRGGDRPVGPAELATAAISTGYGAAGWSDLGPALADALDGDGGPLWELADSYYDFGGFTSYAAVECIDTPPPDGAEAYRAFADRARAQSPRFGGAVANELLPCATWPADPVGTAGPITALGAAPILVVGNTGDAATPYANAVAVAEMLDSGELLTVEMEGHTAYGSQSCARRAIDRYLVDLVLPPTGTTCGR